MKSVIEERKASLSDSYYLLVERYESYLRHRNYSPRVVKEYPQTLTRVLLSLQGEGVRQIEQINFKHLQTYQMSLGALSAKTQSCQIGVIKNFFTYLYKTRQLYLNPSQDLEYPRVTRPLPRGILEVEEIKRVLKCPDMTTVLGVRDRAILELVYSTGIRNTELRTLKVGDVDLEERYFFVLGKGRKEAFVPFGQKAQRALKLYVKRYRPLIKSLEPWLFLSYRGRLLHRSRIGDIVKKYVAQAGIKKYSIPHGLRHSCALHLLRNGADIRHIQELLRHNNLNSTQIYTRVDITDLKEAQSKYHPRDKMGQE